MTQVPPRKPSLLFVDDEPRILSAMRAVFKIGYDVTISTDGYEAIEMLKTQTFDVIISDQRMPTMSGVEFLRIASEMSPMSVRILLTGYSDMDAIVGAINDVEVHRFMQKPWDNGTIKRIVDEAVEIAVALRTAELPTGEAGATPAPPVAAAPAARGAREPLIVIDDETKLFSLIESEFSGKFDVLYSPSISHCLGLMETRPCNVLVCALNVDSETDRLFLMQLKAAYPHIIVITLCNSTDSQRLVDLINQAKVYRFVKKPTNFPVIKRYLNSAIDLAEKQKHNPVLLKKQKAEALPDELKESVAAQQMMSKLQRIKKAFFGRFL